MQEEPHAIVKYPRLFAAAEKQGARAGVDCV
jgi:hypothetical protein